MLRLLHSTIGAKSITGVTGFLLVGFVVFHMLGNLQVFLGRDALNSYAEKLHHLGPLLWVARIGLLGVFALHLYTALTLNARSVGARPEPYVSKRYRQASMASRSMVLSGMFLFGFLALHLAHFTFKWIDGRYATMIETVNGHDRMDVYGMVISGFSDPIMVGLYVVGQLFLGLHLYHGASSMFQTLGLRNAAWKGVVDNVGPTVAAVVVVGNITMPAAVLFGLLPK
ncbi:MAG: succinate dehydrogenase cytochrome b subunit [Planctomycetia bacterium]